MLGVGPARVVAPGLSIWAMTTTCRPRWASWPASAEASAAWKSTPTWVPSTSSQGWGVRWRQPLHSCTASGWYGMPAARQGAPEALSHELRWRHWARSCSSPSVAVPLLTLRRRRQHRPRPLGQSAVASMPCCGATKLAMVNGSCSLPVRSLVGEPTRMPLRRSRPSILHLPKQWPSHLKRLRSQAPSKTSMRHSPARSRVPSARRARTLTIGSTGCWPLACPPRDCAPSPTCARRISAIRLICCTAPRSSS
mmetsp:Transcript_148057/g.369088  ORF Transcript_148057/g.369088 Transcript_148057/m.369088 type:complete len:252 (+) Transcript_148057:2038-2793(+)